MLFSKSLIFPTRNQIVLKAFETSEICFINAETAFGKLEKDQILSNFFSTDCGEKRRRHAKTSISWDRELKK